MKPSGPGANIRCAAVDVVVAEALNIRRIVVAGSRASSASATPGCWKYRM